MQAPGNQSPCACHSESPQKRVRQLQASKQLPDDLPLLLIDGLLIEQVFVNLLENAARYTPPGTQVAVQAAIDGRFVRITPSADGGRGSGLGLAICRAIAKVHGGNIAASNRPGGGAEFILRLLVRKDAPQVSLATLIF